MCQQKLRFFEPSDTFHKVRFYTAAGSGVALYTGLMIGLNQAWYAKQERSKFHLFNDWNEWKNMDKFGHWFTSYSYARFAYQGGRWTGMKENTTLWLASGISFFLQGSIEILDGYSSKWGFSVPDMAFNVLGSASFFTQQKLWNEQRIVFKISSFPKSYPEESLIALDGSPSYSLAERARDLYGNSFAESYLKDYNAQTVWASFNVASFIPKSTWPKWLNLALGYSAENLYAGFDYDFIDNTTGKEYLLDQNRYPRYSQFFLSPDIDFTRIPTKSHFLKTLFQVLNLFKIPAPALEINTLGKVRFHPAYL